MIVSFIHYLTLERHGIITFQRWSVGMRLKILAYQSVDILKELAHEFIKQNINYSL